MFFKLFLQWYFQYSAQSNKPLARMPVWSSSPFISAGRGLLIFQVNRCYISHVYNKKIHEKGFRIQQVTVGFVTSRYQRPTRYLRFYIYGSHCPHDRQTGTTHHALHYSYQTFRQTGGQQSFFSHFPVKGKTNPSTLRALRAVFCSLLLPPAPSCSLPQGDCKHQPGDLGVARRYKGKRYGAQLIFH